MRTGLLIAFGIVIGSTLSTVIAFAWTAPTASPPGNNVASPINTGATSQLKNGTLGVNGLGVFGNTILNGTNGDGTNNGVNSYLNFGAIAGQNGYGIRDNNGTLEFKSTSGSWASLSVSFINLSTLNGITPNGLGQITSIKFADGTTQSTAATANPWSTNGTNVYYSGGNVGVGTNNPASNLHVYGTSNIFSGPDAIGTSIQIDTPGTGGYQQTYLDLATRADGQLLGLTANNLGWQIYARGHSFNYNSDPVDSFGIAYWNGATWNSDRFRILPAGNVGINTHTPGGWLEVVNTGINRSQIVVRGYGSSLGWGLEMHPANDASPIAIAFFNNAGSTVGGIQTNSSNTSYLTTSDRRLKEHVVDTNAGLPQLMQMRVRDFDFTKDPAHVTTTGFIAQELYKVFPEAVSTNGDNGTVPLGASTTPWSVDYGRVTPLIVKAVQDIASLSDPFKQTLIAWLGSDSNGVTDLHTSIVHSHRVQANETDTQKLCISKSDGTNVCVTGDQLAALLASHTTCKTP